MSQTKAPVTQQEKRSPADRAHRAQHASKSQSSNNQALQSGQSIIQRKIHLGLAGDRYEQEADRFAKQFSKMGERSQSTAPAFTPSQYNTVASGAERVGPSLERAIHNSPSQGTPLPKTLSKKAGSSLQHNLDGVRIHSNSHADTLNRSLNSRAFTTGKDIYFRSGEYQPSSSAGQQLIAHELTHVAQQNTRTQAGSSNNSVLQCARYTSDQEVTRLSNGEAIRILAILKDPFFGDPLYRIETSFGDIETISESEINHIISDPFYKAWDFSKVEIDPSTLSPSSSSFSFDSLSSSSYGSVSSEPYGSFSTASFTPTKPETFDTASFSLGSFTPTSRRGRQGSRMNRSRSREKRREKERLERFRRAEKQRKIDQEMRQSEWYRMRYRKRKREDESVDDDFDTMGSPLKRRRLNTSPYKIGKKVQKEIRWLMDNVDDTQELEAFFPYLQHNYGLSKIGFRGLGTSEASVAFRINPSFEVKLNSAKEKIEMRTEGKSSKKYQTKVKWVPQQLSLKDYTKTGNPTKSVTVGGTMTANPLSIDHPAGTLAKADNEQKWMNLIPSLGRRAKTGSGSGDYYYIKGHLLNDNLGGIANEANLYPITADANHIHSNDVEEYIKNGIDNGYVYEYNVRVSTVSVKETKFVNKGKSGTGNNEQLNAIDADMEFQFARLDSSLQPIPKTIHKGTIKSRYQGPLTSGSSSGPSVHPFAKKHDEYQHDYTGGKAKSPFTVGSEHLFTFGTQSSPLTSNGGLVKDIGGSSFNISAPSPTVLGGFGSSVSGPPQSINPGYTPVNLLSGAKKKLSLRNSSKTVVRNYYKNLVTNWSTSNIDKWVKSIKTKQLTLWKDVAHEATLFNLDPTIANQIFDKSKPYIKGVSISGKAG